MAGRLIFGHLPDKIGGARVALVCVLIEAVGQALIWLAPSSTMALIGASVTGLGYSLVYPGFGVEAVRHAPPQSRGLAMGAYTAFLDLALGLANPMLGLVARRLFRSGCARTVSSTQEIAGADPSNGTFSSNHLHG
jgi:MFS family permease